MVLGAVKIGPAFFANEFRDYADWRWAIIREFVQNSVDAPGCNAINITVKLDDEGDTILTVENNGAPMTEETLVGKLLCLGESGKGFQGTVGGFGKAKIILYFAHKSYTIFTGGLRVLGCGGDYQIDNIVGSYKGTASRVTIAGNHVEKLTEEARRFASFMQWKGTLTLNGETLATSLRKGSPRRELPFGTLYTNNTAENKLIVRIGGIPMFKQYISLNKCVILELKGSSLDLLTANRDGLLSKHGQVLRAFLDELAADKTSALRQAKLTKYEKYDGTRQSHSREKKEEESKVDNEFVVVTSEEPTDPTNVIAAVEDTEIATAALIARDATPVEQVQISVPVRENCLGTEFMVKNDTDLKIPEYYKPGDKFSKYSERLATYWGRIMLQMHRTFEEKLPVGLTIFSVGFVFSTDSEAEHEVHPQYGRMYLLNPAKVVSQVSSNSRSFRNRYALTQRDHLIMVGLHEFIHGLGHSWHDETYANVLTDMAGVVMANRASFNWCFK